jgi:uracil-DNA glycosylase family 4
VAAPGGGCKGCPLETLGEGWVEVDGRGDYGVLLVGESLGEEEVYAKRPFVGKAGQLLNRVIARTLDPVSNSPLERDKFWISNTIWCRPPNNELVGAPYQQGALDACFKNLDSLVKQLKPRAIVALGDVALKRLTGLSGITHWRGSVLESQYGWVIPTLHPSYVMRGNFHLAPVLSFDILRALLIARNGAVDEEIRYLEDPTLQGFKGFIEEFKEAGCPPLAADIETNYSQGQDEALLEDMVQEDDGSYQINRISFSFQPKHAVSIPWAPPFIEFVQVLFDLASSIVWWNKGFDVPRLEASGIDFKGRHIDAMWQHHFLQPALPYNLQFASSLYVGSTYRAWKHTSSGQPAWYSCRDSDYTIRNFQVLQRKLEETGKAEIFDRHFTQFMAVLGRMSKRGVAVDREARAAWLQKFGLMLEDVQATVQDFIPLKLKPKKIFKISRERLEAKFGTLEAPHWIEIEEQLTESELVKLEQRKLKEELKAAALRLKAEALAAKVAAKAEAKRLKSLESTSRKIRKMAAKVEKASKEMSALAVSSDTSASGTQE